MLLTCHVPLRSSRSTVRGLACVPPMQAASISSTIRMEFLEPTNKRTGCAYKGFARYWSVSTEKTKHEDIAWSYATPIADCAKIAGLSRSITSASRSSSMAYPRSAAVNRIPSSCARRRDRRCRAADFSFSRIRRATRSLTQVPGSADPPRARCCEGRPSRRFDAEL